MSVKISANKDDELNGVSVRRGHPLKTLYEDEGTTKDDVFWLFIPNATLEEMIQWCKKRIEVNKDLKILFTGDIELRNNFDLSILTQHYILTRPCLL
jgi:hypothetical protein